MRRAGAIEVTEEQANKIINKTMSSEEWKADVSRFPKEWQTQVESVMAKALGHGIHAGKCAYSETEEKAFRNEEYRDHLENHRKATSENGGVPIRLGIDTP